MQARAESTRRRILEAAVDLFDEYGYGQTRLAAILQRSGVSKGTAYYHFGSQQAVASAIIEDGRRRIEDAVREHTSHSVPALERMIEGDVHCRGNP